MVELLAPVGSKEALIAAVEAGADAVYLGGKMFGARAYASNFSDEELAQAIQYAHLKGVLVYLTVNTLVDDSEIPALINYLKHLYEIGVDAILVQDVGVAKIAQKVIPNMPLHASTQMTVYNLAGVQMLTELGFKRVVLAREVSLEDIKHICANSPVDIEVFTHGALCVCYSGQCLMSSLIGGRSGNRGRCAQPCRLPYTLVDKNGQDVLQDQDVGQYLLSPKDFNTIEVLPQLLDAGVVSLKIEGRMKRPEYVATVVSAYRQAIDLYVTQADSYHISDETKHDLAQIFNRDFTSAYLFGKEGRNMMSDRRPNNRGVRVGRVLLYDHKDKTVTVKLDEKLAVGDIVEFWVKVGGRVSSTITSIVVNGKNVPTARPGDEAVIPVNSPVKQNDRVFKTFDADLMGRARAYFTGAGTVNPIPVDIRVEVSQGQPLVIRMEDVDGFTGSAATQFIAEKARNRPLDENTIRKQVERLGNTVFTMRNLLSSIEGDVMVPVSEINEARRRAVEDLSAARLARFNRAPSQHTNWNNAIDQTNKKPERINTKLAVNVDTIEKVESAVKSGADVIWFGGETYNHRSITEEDYREAVRLVHQHGKKIILNTPRIIKEWQVSKLKKELSLFEELQPNGVGVNNVGTFYLAKEFDISLHGDFSLNVYNSAAMDFYRDLGLKSMTLSPELNFSQLEALMPFNRNMAECIVHGYLEMMVSEYCVIGSYVGQLHTGKCSQACQKGEYWLKDRMGELFRVFTDQFCRMHLVNAKELSMLPHVAKFKELGFGRIRIEGKSYSATQVAKITNLYRTLLDEGNSMPELINGRLPMEHEDITRGHYFRGVL